VPPARVGRGQPDSRWTPSLNASAPPFPGRAIHASRPARRVGLGRSAGRNANAVNLIMSHVAPVLQHTRGRLGHDGALVGRLPQMSPVGAPGPLPVSRWSRRSDRSILSIGSTGSILSIGSVGSILSIGSIGSIGSILSIGSVASMGSALSAASIWSAMSFRARRGTMTSGTDRGNGEGGPR
jgi:hypothetical protein